MAHVYIERCLKKAKFNIASCEKVGNIGEV